MLSKGSILIHNGSNFYPIAPSSSNQTLISDLNSFNGASWNEQQIQSKQETINIIDTTSIINLSYETVAIYAHTPTINGNISSIYVVTYMQPGATSYDVRVIDVTNSNTIAEHNYNNTSIELKELTISNIPTDISRIDFQLKRNGGLVNNAAIIKKIIIVF